MRWIGYLSLLISMVQPANASLVLANFESGGLSGWTVVGGPWTVGGTTGTSPNIAPADGLLFARSGAPNVTTGALAESNVGTLTSPAYSVAFDTFSWISASWSGPSYDGKSYFEILDSSFATKAKLPTTQSDSWKTVSVNLISLGFSPGAKFHFRAVDTKNVANYAWISIDALTLSGRETPVLTPEPATMLMMAGGFLILAVQQKRRR